MAALGIQLAHRVSFQVDTTGAVHDAVADRIGDGGLADHLMPGRHRQLRHHQRRGATVAIFEYLQQCQPRQSVQLLQSKIIDLLRCRNNEKESIRAVPESSERWPLATLPGTVRIGLIELNRAPIYGDWNAGIGCRRCAVGGRKSGGSRGMMGRWCCHRAMRRRRAVGGQIAGSWRTEVRSGSGRVAGRGECWSRADGVVVFASCGVGRAAAKRSVLPGGLRSELLNTPHGHLVARRTATRAGGGGSLEACFDSRRCDHVVAGDARNQAAAQRQFFLACTIGEKAVVTNADEAIGQDMLQETTQKLDRIEFHHPVTVAANIALVAEAMGIAGEIFQQRNSDVWYAGTRACRRPVAHLGDGECYRVPGDVAVGIDSAGKQPVARPIALVVAAQVMQQDRRQGHQTMLAAFALHDMQQHPLAVGVCDPQRDRLGNRAARPHTGSWR